MASPCIFCEIIAGRQTARYYRDDNVPAFHDLFPRAPVHILIVPNQHFDSVNSLDTGDTDIISHLILTAQKLADEEGLSRADTVWLLTPELMPDNRYITCIYIYWAENTCP